MRSSFGLRTLLGVFGVLVALLAALAIVQYRWSARVAAADTQREREHLDSAASLFASNFDGLLIKTVQFLQENARPALRPGAKLSGGVPKLFDQIYYVNENAPGLLNVKRLEADGRFVSSAPLEWMRTGGCSSLITERPPAIVISIFDIVRSEEHRQEGGFGVLRTFRTFGRNPEQCFVAVIDLRYLRDTLFPRLIQESFGEETARQYDFEVASHAMPPQVLYGTAVRPDLRKPFFSLSPVPAVPNLRPKPIPGLHKEFFYVGQIQRAAVIDGQQQIPDLLGSGIWELNISHKGLPLNDAFERIRQRDLLFSLAVELLLVAGMMFLLITARRMQQLADQKMQFVAGVSHELRTPVSSIAMLSRNQADGLVTGADKVKQYGELIHQQSRRLSEMVEQTLHYAGIQSGLRRQSRHEIDVAALIDKVVCAHRDELVRSGFAIQIDVNAELPAIVGDTQLLQTALDNLLSNVQKYAGDGRWICVRASYSAAEKEVRISVEDRGAGIDPEDRAEIFEPFYRGRSAVQAQIPGSGLGLSLVRSAVDAHRGAVSLESAPGRGSTFTLHLPA